MEPRAPDHIRHVEDAAVLQHGQPVPHAHGPGDPLDPGSGQVLGLDPDQRHAMGKQLRAHLAAHRRVHGQHAMEDEPETRGKKNRPAMPSMRNGRWPVSLPDSQSGDQARPQGDLGARVARAHDEYASIPQLGGVPVGARMQLDDAGIKLPREGGTRGLCQFAIATTTFSASNRRSPAVTTNRSPCLERRPP